MAQHKRYRGPGRCPGAALRGPGLRAAFLASGLPGSGLLGACCLGAALLLGAGAAGAGQISIVSPPASVPVIPPTTTPPSVPATGAVVPPSVKPSTPVASGALPPLPPSTLPPPGTAGGGGPGPGVSPAALAGFDTGQLSLAEAAMASRTITQVLAAGAPGLSPQMVQSLRQQLAALERRLAR